MPYSELAPGGSGSGRPPGISLVGFPGDEDDESSRESQLLIAAIQEILDTEGMSSARKHREIEALLGIARQRPKGRRRRGQ